MSKKDTNFGKTILQLAREVYGDDFMFSKCTITAHSDKQFVVTFEMIEIELPVLPCLNSLAMALSSNLERDVDELKKEVVNEKVRK